MLHRAIATMEPTDKSPSLPLSLPLDKPQLLCYCQGVRRREDRLYAYLPFFLKICLEKVFFKAVFCLVDNSSSPFRGG